MIATIRVALVDIWLYFLQLQRSQENLSDFAEVWTLKACPQLQTLEPAITYI